MSIFIPELAQHPEGLVQRKRSRRFHSTQSATNTFVLRVRPLWRLELKAIFVPSGENIGKESNALSWVTCSNSPVSRSNMKMLKGNPPVWWLDENKTFVPEGWK